MSANLEGNLSESFESLEAAVLETQRGRWFLEEYAKRQRSAETLAILAILRKLEDAIVNTKASAAINPGDKISAEQLKFFKKDEELFVEPTLATRPVAVATPPTLPPQSAPSAAAVVETRQASECKGAKLKIQRVSPTGQPEEAKIPEAVTLEALQAVAPEPAAVELCAPAPAPAGETKSRVVIIRRPASEVTEIPLIDEKNPEVAA
jgi:hypothetical protein